MPQPYNYSLNVPNPADALTRGLQTGVQVADVAAQAQLRDQQSQAAQAKAQRQQQFQRALGALGPNPSAKQLSGILLQYPEMSDLLKEGYNRLSAQEQQERTGQASAVYNAVLAGDNKLAIDQLNEYAAAYRNAGREDDAKALEAKAKLIELHPEAAEKGISLWLAQAMGPEKFAATFGELQNQRRNTAKEGTELTKAEAEARKAVVASKWAESEAVQKSNLNEAQLINLQQEPFFKRENLKIATLNAQLTREKNEIEKKKLESQLQDAQIARDEKLRTRIADAKSGAASIDNLLNTADGLLKTPIGVLKAATGPVDAVFPTLQTDVAAFEEQLETLTSQAFLSQIPTLKGLGALSNAEGEKLQKALANLSFRQGYESLLPNLREAQRLLLKSREVLATKYGVELGAPDTPNAAQDPDSDDVNALVSGANTAAANSGTARY